MKDAILMLDDIRIDTKYMSEGLNRPIKLVDNVLNANGRLDIVPKLYAVLLIEPFLYNNKLDKISELRSLCIHSDLRDVPVIVYSTQSQNLIESMYGLEKGLHYAEYVSKINRPADTMIATLDRLLKK